ncbi:carbohydrate sulfotransferase 1-like [Mizuhopecten yessoensis]|nr:carbohydrate sulfotransferase 1-like [Mizuhopecten yessoensis]
MCFNESPQSVRARNLFQPHRKVSHVLIVTHPRSGSTLTGDIIQKSGSSFYAFEPLRFAGESIQLGQPVIYLNGTQRVYNNSRDAVWVEADILYRWFTCDFCRVNIQDLKSKFIESFSTNLREYAVCLNRYRFNPLPRCLSQLRKTCEQATVRSIKTVRLQNLESIPILLRRLPSLKVIYLVRDPRGRLASQAALDPTEWNIVEDQAETMCTQMYQEFRYIAKIWKHLAGRLKILMYEKFAKDPIDVSKRLFEFLDIDFTEYLQFFVKTVTHVDLDKTGCYWCTKRTNSRETATRWRRGIEYSHVKKIDDQCSDVYNELGYMKIRNEHHLRNMSLSIIGKSNHPYLYV